MNLGAWNAVFAVPSVVVDKHIKLAGAAQLKVLLWTLRHAGEPFETEDIATALSMHPADVHDSMQYWIETGLIVEQSNALRPANAAPAASAAPTAPAAARSSPPAEAKAAAPEPPAEHRPRPLSRPQKPDSLYVSKRIAECSDLASMVQEAQMILGKTISNGDCATLIMLHDNDGLPADVILMLLQYAVSIGKSNMRYIEKVGVSWAEEEIDSHEKAERKIRRLGEMRQAWRQVEQVVGLEQRSPSAKEAEAASRWVCEWSFSPEMIRLAYDRCVDAKGKYIVGYMDSILRRWQSEGIKTPQQAMAEQRPKTRASAGGGYAPSYDIEAYERTSIFDDYHNEKE